MLGRPAKLVLASAASLLLATPAFAGGDYYGEDQGAAAPCNCAPAQPQVRVIESVQPVTYYARQTVIVPQQVYVRRQVLVPQRAYVRTQSYLVDQGPTYDVPPVRYRAATVSYPSGNDYPYARSPRIYGGGYGAGYAYGGGYGAGYSDGGYGTGYAYGGYRARYSYGGGYGQYGVRRYGYGAYGRYGWRGGARGAWRGRGYVRPGYRPNGYRPNRYVGGPRQHAGPRLMGGPGAQGHRAPAMRGGVGRRR